MMLKSSHDELVVHTIKRRRKVDTKDEVVIAIQQRLLEAIREVTKGVVVGAARYTAPLGLMDALLHKVNGLDHPHFCNNTVACGFDSDRSECRLSHAGVLWDRVHKGQVEVRWGCSSLSKPYQQVMEDRFGDSHTPAVRKIGDAIMARA
jgi:hypothetical protein